ncbi:MAG TPA: class I tRNA ligase family protein, partial [Spirochaetota bacterium]|nr:class I tRNA ligase family protein [Spirochaetota bacterium]
HHNMLTVDGSKMGKSLGNFIILKDLFKKTDPMVLRFYILQGHYRSPLDFTDEALNASAAGFERLKNSIFSLRKTVTGDFQNSDSISEEDYPDIKRVKEDFLSAMDDDINTPIAISVLYELMKISNVELSSDDKDMNKLALINRLATLFAEEILGLKIGSVRSQSKEDELIELFIEMRNDFRKNKNFAMSDKIRDDLKGIGIILKDGSSGTTYSK